MIVKVRCVNCDTVVEANAFDGIRLIMDAVELNGVFVGLRCENCIGDYVSGKEKPKSRRRKA